MSSKALSQSLMFRLLVVFCLLIALVAAAGYAFFHYIEAAAKTETTEHLGSTGKLGAGYLAAFLNERRGDARLLSEVLSEDLDQDWWQARDRAPPPAPQKLLKTALASYGYIGALILNAKANVSFSTGRSVGLSDMGKRNALRVLNQAAPVFSDLYLADPAAPESFMLDTFAPIMSRAGDKVVGVLVLRGDWDQLFALTQPWPDQRPSAEYLLARKDGDDVLFLNQLRHQPQNVPRLRVPLAGDERSPAWPAIRAVQGHYGAVESVDYRGKAVLAYSLPIPDTDWSMVVKADVEEVLAGAQRLENITLIAVLVFNVFVFALSWQWLHGRATLAHQRERDIADLRLAEAALNELNSQLEQRIKERTAKLEAANQALETFTYSVAHDLKAPLRGIDGYSRLLQESYSDKLDDEGRGFLRNVRRATQHMGQLIDDLLAYSRLEHSDVQMGQVNLQELIESLLAKHAHDIRTRDVAVTVAVPFPSVNADREGLSMALRNLLENALKFTRNVPRPMIETSGRDTEAACILSVRDNGVGFDMKFHDRIFDIFQRLHRSEDYPGTGVGLAIARKAMQRMGGRAWAESEPGKGATFYLEIPK